MIILLVYVIVRVFILTEKFSEPGLKLYENLWENTLCNNHVYTSYY